MCVREESARVRGDYEESVCERGGMPIRRLDALKNENGTGKIRNKRFFDVFNARKGAVNRCERTRWKSVIAEGSNQMRDPEQSRRDSAEGRKNGEAVS
jgi:hypothetical protein